MTVICTKGGKFAPRDGSKPFTLKPGDEVPAGLAEAALRQGWGKEAEVKPVSEPDAGQKDD